MPSPSIAMLTPHGDPLGRIGDPDIGGQCVYVRELSRTLSDLGCRVVVYTRDRGDGRSSREPFAEHAEVVRVPCGPQGFIPKEQLLPHLGEFAGRVAREISDVEIIHSHYWDGGFVASKLRGRQRWLHTTHSIGMLKQQALPDDAKYAYEDRIRIETDVYRHCDYVVALTDLEKSQIAELYDVPESHITVISPGVDPATYRPPADRDVLRARLGLPSGHIVFTLGRLDERKGFDLFLRAAGDLLRHTDLVPHFVISAGVQSESERKERVKMDRIAVDQGLGDRLLWRDILPPSEVPDYYGVADVFVLPSRYEPFGIVMLEAMACGTPVVATRHGGPSKVIEDGVDGFLVDPLHPSDVSQAIARVLASDTLRSQFGLRGRKKVETAYGWPVIAKRHLAAYVGEHHAR